MMRRVSAESLRIAAASVLLAVGSCQVLADSGDSPSSNPASSNVANPAQAFTRLFAGNSSTDSSGVSTPPKRHHRTHHATATASIPASSPAASWLPQTSAMPVEDAAPPATTDAVKVSSSAPIASNFSKASSESRVADWLPSSDNGPAAEDSGSSSTRIDLIEEKYGKQATVDFNSRIQEPNGVIAFRAIDNQTGERQTIRIDRSGEIKLKSGWPE